MEGVNGVKLKEQIENFDRNFPPLKQKQQEQLMELS